MQTFSCVIESSQGLHARPCASIASTCMTFSSKTIMEYKGNQYNPTNPIELMGAGALSGEELAFYIDGENEEKEAAILKEIIEKELA